MSVNQTSLYVFQPAIKKQQANANYKEFLASLAGDERVELDNSSIEKVNTKQILETSAARIDTNSLQVRSALTKHSDRVMYDLSNLGVA